MMLKYTVVIAMAVALASPAFAGTKRAVNVGFENAVFNTNGRYLGSDPDPRVRAQIAMDRNTE